MLEHRNIIRMIGNKFNKANKDKYINAKWSKVEDLLLCDCIATVQRTALRR